jgi:hypothetical protein
MSGFEETTTTAAPLVECSAYNSSYFCDSSRCTWSCGKRNNCICIETATFQAIYIGIGVAAGVAFLVTVVCKMYNRPDEIRQMENAGHNNNPDDDDDSSIDNEPVTGEVVRQNQAVFGILATGNNHNTVDNASFNSDDNVFNNNGAGVPPPPPPQPGAMFYPGTTYPVVEQPQQQPNNAAAVTDLPPTSYMFPGFGVNPPPPPSSM